MVISPTQGGTSDEEYFSNLRPTWKKKVKVEGKKKEKEEEEIEKLMEAGREEEQGWNKGDEEGVRTRRRTRAEKRKEEERKKDTPEEGRVNQTEGIGLEGCAGVSVAALGAMALDWLTELDEMWVKAGLKKRKGVEDKGKGLQGGISGQMKAKITEIKEVARSLTARALVSGDVPFLRKKNEDLRTQIKEKEDQLRERVRMIRDLEETVRKLEKRREEEDARRFSREGDERLQGRGDT